MAPEPIHGADEQSPIQPGRRRHRPPDRARRAAALAALPEVEVRRAYADPIDLLYDLASRGLLADTVAVASPGLRATLSTAAYEVALPVVFERITRGLERRRGHHRCASSFLRLTDDCHDGFTDDMEAVVSDLLRYADVAIRDVPAWIAMRAPGATVDANRIRRGARGALQRPRVPRWLIGKLGADPWLTELARLILVWVGVPNVAGSMLWPLDAWSQLRAEATGGRPDPAATQRDVDTVIAAMRRVKLWYDAYVERPLGLKQTGVAAIVPGTEPLPFAVVPRDELREAHLTALAAAALDRIEARLASGDDPLTVVSEVVRTVFGEDPGHLDLDDPPHAGAGSDAHLDALLADGAELARVTRAVLDILESIGRRRACL
jgi:hypothetical protein